MKVHGKRNERTPRAILRGRRNRPLRTYPGPFKEKKLIIGIFLIAVVVAIAASYMMKPVYRVSAVVGPGKIYELEPVRDTLIWREKDIDTPENIERLISQNPFHHAILTQLGWDYEDPKSRFDIKTNVQQRTNYIFVNVDSAEPERAQEYLNPFLDQIDDFIFKERR